MASGAFETCRVRDGKILHFKEHMERLKASLKTLGAVTGTPSRNFEPPRTLLRKLVEMAGRIQEGHLRVAARRDGDFLVHRWRGASYPERLRREGVRVSTVPSRWPLGETAVAQTKGSERLSQILARLEADEAGEVLRIGPHGYLTEGNVSNFFLVKNRTLTTPPAWLGVLEGLMRAQVLKAAHLLKIPILEVPVTRHELFNAEEAFLTNVLMGILPIRSLDGRRIGGNLPGPVTRRLIDLIDGQMQ